MAYSGFAYWYDALNTQADYDILAKWLLAALREGGIEDGIVADLGCGTGEVTLRLAKAGYDMIAVDCSGDMLAVLREKLEPQQHPQILLLQQDIAELDLYGTIRAAVSTFDTFNHCTKQQLHKALQRTALFMEPGGLLLLDANTPYKHEHVLANREFCVEGDGVRCVWQNRYDKERAATHIKVTGYTENEKLFIEDFWEYAYPLELWRQLLAQTGFALEQVVDGERFTPLAADSQRYLFVARRADI